VIRNVSQRIRSLFGTLLSMAPGPLPLLAAAFIAGLACPLDSKHPTLWWIFPLAAFSVLFARFGLRRAALLSLLPAFALAGSLRGVAGAAPVPGPAAGPCAEALLARSLPPPTEASRSRLEIEGRVLGTPKLGFETNRTLLAVQRARPARERAADPPPPWKEAAGLTIQLAMARDLRPLPGDSIRAVATLDDVEVGLPGGADARRRLQLAGASCSARVQGGRIVVLEEGGGLLPRIEATRRRISAKIEDQVDASPEAALLAALSVGDRSLVSPGQNDRFAASGLAHILSVSGLHLSLTILGLYAILRWLLGRLPFTQALDPPRLAALFVLPVIPAYALLTGAEAPVLRAAIGTGLYLLAQLVMRAPEAWSALAAAAFAILIWEPAALHEISFQLSFAACLGLLALAPGIRRMIPVRPPAPDASFWRRWLEAPLLALATTLGATLATLPLTALYFQRASLASLPANVVAVPVGLAVTALCALAAGVGLVARSLMTPILWLAAPLARLLDWLAAWFATWPGARIPIPSPSPTQMIATWIIAVAAANLRRAPKLAGVAILGGILTLLTPSAFTSADPPRLRIHFLAVGQGDATLLQLPGGGRLLVDTGGDLRGERDLAQRVLIPQLTGLGVTSLNALILSHLHPDHVGSVPSLLGLMQVDELWTSGRPLEGRFGDPIQEALELHGIPRRLLASGSPPIEFGEVRIEVLGPPDRDGLMDDPLLGANDASLVLRIVHGDVAILLPGDVEVEGEEALIAAGADLRAQLLKAPHHGSSTSSTPALLERVRPHHVVFCVGYRNQFDFPRADVIERYRGRGCQLHRTDRGIVSFTSDGRTLELASERR